MNITLNGKNIDLPEGTTLKDIVTRFSKHPEHVITEVDGSLVRRALWEKTLVLADEKVELVTFVGGG